jgi:hypothetical protein
MADPMPAIPPLWRESRFPSELRALGRDPVVAGVGVPHGDGEPVLLIPGFLAGDNSLATMTLWLRRLGYRTSRAGIRTNVDCSTAAVERLENRLHDLHDRYGKRVSIVGQSRGGVFARWLAVRNPELVSGIVTLGSPLRDQLAIHPLVRLQVGLVGALGTFGIKGVFGLDCLKGACCHELRGQLCSPMPDEVGFVSVYSRSDGVVRWKSCLDEDAELVEVDASHCGMAVHPGVYRAIGEALGAFREDAVEPPAPISLAA